MRTDARTRYHHSPSGTRYAGELAFLGIVVLLVLINVASDLPRTGAAERSVPAAHRPDTLAAGITELRRAPEATREGYARDAFRHWIDGDGDGCDTRAEVLLSEARVVSRSEPGCRITSGRWISSYDGLIVTDAGALDIDHLVPLAEAWDSGADAWSEHRRERFANDLGLPAALIAVSAASNRSKGDRDPAEWLPPADESHCTYAAAWVAVKRRWGLAADPAERRALQAIAGRRECAGTRLPHP